MEICRVIIIIVVFFIIAYSSYQKVKNARRLDQVITAFEEFAQDIAQDDSKIKNVSITVVRENENLKSERTLGVTRENK